MICLRRYASHVNLKLKCIQTLNFEFFTHLIESLDRFRTELLHRKANAVDGFFLLGRRLGVELVGQTNQLLFNSLWNKIAICGQRQLLTADVVSRQPGAGVSFADSGHSLQVEAIVRTILPQHGCSQRAVQQIGLLALTIDAGGIALQDANIMQQGAIVDELNVDLQTTELRVAQDGECLVSHLSAVQQKKTSQWSVFGVKMAYNVERIHLFIYFLQNKFCIFNFFHLLCGANIIIFFEIRTMNCKFSSFLSILALFSGQMISCTAQNSGSTPATQIQVAPSEPTLTGAQRMEEYLPMLEGRKVALLVNQTSVVETESGRMVPLVDTLLECNIDVRFLMTPEHGLQGLVSAGDAVGDTRYGKRQDLPVYSLYGKNKKPRREWLEQADCVMFDVQDVGCRFYTYLSTLYYLVEACAESGTELIVLDRPNPHDTIDGPVLDLKFKSFVGMLPIPLLHGCTLGELARMMVGENWTSPNIQTGSTGKKSCQLTVVTCSGWNHGDDYSLPVAPSPNLRTDHAIRLYPSLCLLEATDVSVGRGTDWPFEVLGHPEMQGEFSFTPQSVIAATHPLQEGKQCKGLDLRQETVNKGFHLKWLQTVHRQLSTAEAPTGWIKQNSFFDRLAGTDRLRQQISAGLNEEEIRNSWQADLEQYKTIRKKYLLYKE